MALVGIRIVAIGAIATAFALATTAGAQPAPPRKGDAGRPAPKTTTAAKSSCPAFVPARMTRSFNVERAYPLRAIEREIEGSVSFRASITETGAVSEVTIVSSDPPGVFDQAVMREVQRIRFEPAQRRCRPVPDEFSYTVDFKLD